jgi:hypothetical protein
MERTVGCSLPGVAFLDDGERLAEHFEGFFGPLLLAVDRAQVVQDERHARVRLTEMRPVVVVVCDNEPTNQPSGRRRGVFAHCVWGSDLRRLRA